MNSSGAPPSSLHVPDTVRVQATLALRLVRDERGVCGEWTAEARSLVCAGRPLWPTLPSRTPRRATRMRSVRSQILVPPAHAQALSAEDVCVDHHAPVVRAKSIPMAVNSRANSQAGGPEAFTELSHLRHCRPTRPVAS